jgi:carbon-monoxide dehydrogenase large subunit
MNAPLTTAARFIGQRVPRKEDLRLLTGKGQFADDVTVPGLLHAAFARSPIARGKLRRLDVSAARELAGVHAVFTGTEIGAIAKGLASGQFDPPLRPVPPMAIDSVAHVGDPFALVIAESRAIAEDAAGLILADFEEEPAVVSLGDARAGAPVFADRDDNVAATAELPEVPGLDEALAGAAHQVSVTIRHQRIAHSTMETRGVVVVPRGSASMEVHIGCQSPETTARFLNMIFDRPDLTFRVLARDVGGAFGLKARPWREEVAVITAGLLLGKPIKWIEDRYENLTCANQAREQECTLTAGFDADGRIVASKAVGAINNGAYPHYPDANGAAMMFMWTAYKVPLYHFASQGLYSNTTGLAAYRGPWAMESLARETLLDIAARQMGSDPIELRQRNLLTAADQPHRTMIGMMLEDVTPAECLDLLLTKVDVAAFRKEQATAREQGRYLGLGIATYIEPTASGMFPPFATEVAQARIDPSGKISVVMGTHSQGQGTETTMAQIVADRLGVSIDDVTVLEGDSSRLAFGGGAGGSRQAVSGGGAAILAADKLLAKIKVLAAHLSNASVEDITVIDGTVHVAGADEMSRSLKDLAAIAYGQPGRLPQGMEAGLEEQARFNVPPVTFASAAHACVVEVDVDTGLVKILRWVCAEDCGVVINPSIVEGQIAGGIAQAIGGVLLEKVAYDSAGNPLAVTFKDYKLPLITDLPKIEYAHIVTPTKAPGGFRGVGEGGNIIGPPTLINAIHDALAPFGVTCLDLPLTPAKLIAEIEKAR